MAIHVVPIDITILSSLLSCLVVVVGDYPFVDFQVLHRLLIHKLEETGSQHPVYGFGWWKGYVFFYIGSIDECIICNVRSFLQSMQDHLPIACDKFEVVRTSTFSLVLSLSSWVNTALTTYTSAFGSASRRREADPKRITWFGTTRRPTSSQTLHLVYWISTCRLGPEGELTYHDHDKSTFGIRHICKV